jgi:hypothetical protein
LLANLYSPDGGWFNRVAGTLLQGMTLGTLDAPVFAPATGYIAFFTLALYIAGLIVLAFAVNDEAPVVTHSLVDNYRQLSAAERQTVREAILDEKV